jgi:murein DD-endopeptidase MepM/ murein hydrolase activator NlpD
MNERSKEQIQNKKVKKDMYAAVLISQILAVIILAITFGLTVKSNESSYNYLKNILSEEKFALGDIITSVREYFSTDNPLAVFGDKVSYVNDEDETLAGAGGDDLKLYEAAKNTSFSPIRLTSPAVSPIEKGRYTSYFGYRINPITDEFSFHTGLDIAATEGTKIRAVLGGRVSRTGEDSRAGKYIFLEHSDGFVTFYCHCSELTAEEGANIRQGETIAKVGSTGWSTGPHLHFEVRKNNIRYNPLFVLENDTYCK